jgi:hypothetical protein
VEDLTKNLLQKTLSGLDRESLQRISDADERKHDIAIRRIEERIFLKQSVEQLHFILNSREVIRPIASFTVCGTKVDRRLALGGVQYEFKCDRADTRLWISIKHSAGTAFDVFVSVQAGTQQYTRLSTQTSFENLGEHVFKCVNTVRSEYSVPIIAPKLGNNRDLKL